MSRTAAAVALLVVVVTAVPAAAAERSVADVVLIEQGAVIDDDLYAAGNRVVIEGQVNGDLVVAAYEDVTITGTVTGDVSGVAGSVRVPGRVGQSIRVVTPRTDITGVVGGDVVVVAGTATLAGDVRGGVTMWGWEADMAGVIEGDLEGQMRHLALGGRVGGNVDVTVAALRVEAGAIVGEDLGYRSQRIAAGVEDAEVGGVVVHRLPLPPNIRIRALLVLAKLVLGLTAAVVGLLVMWATPRLAEAAIAGVEASWRRAWLRGLGVFLLPLAVIALAALLIRFAPVEAAVPLTAVFIPLLLAVFGVGMALAFLSPVAAFPWLGRIGDSSRGPVRAFLYGASLVILAALIPWAMWLIVLFVVPVGMGGWLSTVSGRQTQRMG